MEFEPGAKSFRSFMRTAFLLEELLGREVELVTPESLSPHMRDGIVRSAVLCRAMTCSFTFWKRSSFLQRSSEGLEEPAFLRDEVLKTGVRSQP